MALDPTDPYANDPFMSFINGTGAYAPQPTPDPLALGPTPAPTVDEVPRDALAAQAPSEAQSGQWWPSSWLAGGEAAQAAAAVPAVGPEPAGSPMRDPLAATTDATPGALPPDGPPMIGPSPTPPPPEPKNEPGLGALAADAAENIAIGAGNFGDTDPARLQAKLESADPARFAQIAEAHKLAGDEASRTAVLEEATRNRIAAENNYKAYTKATEHALQERDRLMVESQKLANEKIDRHGWWDRKSTLGKFGAIVQAVVGGLVAGRTGGPNEGLKLLQKEMDDYVEDRKADLTRRGSELQRQQGLVSTTLSQVGDTYRAGELARQAAYETVLREIDAKRQAFDPKGTQALRLATVYRDVKAQQAQALQAFTERTQKTAFDQWYKASEIDVKRAELQGKQAAAAARASMGGGGAGAAAATAGGFDEKAILEPQQFRALYPGLADEDVPPIAMSKKQHDSWMESRGKQALVAKTRHELGTEGRKVALERGGFGNIELDKDGKPAPFIPNGTAESVEKFRTKFSASVGLVNLMDQAMSLRSGWTSDIGKSEEWQRLRSIWGAAVLQAKNAGELGVLAGPDMEVIEKWIGTDDPTKMRGVEHAVDQARRNIEAGLRNDLSYHGLSKEAAIKWKIANPYEGKAKAMPDDAKVNLVLKESNQGDFHNETNPSKEELTTKLREWNAVGNILPSQKTTLDGWFADLRKPADSKEFKFALESLTKASKESGTPGVRDYAKKLLSLEADIGTTPLPAGQWSGGTGLTYQP